MIIVAVLGLGVSVAYAAHTVDWRGVTWNHPYGDIALNTDDQLEVTTSSCFPTSCWGTAHYNTPGSFRSADTPWVKITFADDGRRAAGPQLWMEKEGSPNAAWTQFGTWQRDGIDTYQIYWWNVDTNADGFVDTGVLRTPREHTIVLAMRADGTVDYWLDSRLVFSTTEITPAYFGDIYLAGHSDPSNPGTVVTYTDYEVGTDYPGPPSSVADCAGDGWQSFHLFPNAGLCVAAVVTP